MSLKIKFLSVLTVTASAVVFSTVSVAQDAKPAAPAAPQKAEKPFKGERRRDGMGKEGREGFMGRHGGHGKMGGAIRMIHGLNLTDAQKEQIRTILQSNKPDQASRDKMKALRGSRTPGTPPTDEQKAQMKAFREQARTKATSVHEQILNVLTAEQKAQLQQRRQEMKQKFEDRREHRKDKPAATAKPKTK